MLDFLFIQLELLQIRLVPLLGIVVAQFLQAVSPSSNPTNREG